MKPIEQINECGRLCIEYQKLQDSVTSANPNWGEDDPRHTLIEIPKKAVFNFRVTLCFINGELTIPEWWDKNVNFTSPEQRQSMYETYDIFQKAAHYFMFISHFESQIRKVFRLYKPGKCNDGLGPFRNVIDSLIASLGLSSFSSTIEFMVDIRNTLHNNGYYFPTNGKHKTHTFKGNSYDFVVGDPIDALPPKTFFGIVEEILLLTGKIVTHPDIIALK